MPKPRRRPSPPPQYSDVTPERLRQAHGAWHLGGDERSRVRVLTMVDRPFEKLAISGQINERQYHAGQKFKLHAERLGINGRFGSIDLGAVGGGFDPSRYGNLPPFHLDRYRAARTAMGDILGSIVEAVVVHEKSPKDIAPLIGRSSEGRLGAQTVVKQLCLGLDRLADEWM